MFKATSPFKTCYQEQNSQKVKKNEGALAEI